MNTGKHVSELEMYQKALSKIKISEATIPMCNGKIIKESDTYSKVEKLLASPEMEQSHRFLYDIDFDQLDDDTIKKVDELYDLATKQGLIEIDAEEELDATSPVTEDPDGVESGEGVAEVVPSSRNVVNCYTCFYSAIKNGEIKTGECYSNAPTPEQAKVDAISKLGKIGFSDINIIAIETGDTDLADCEQIDMTATNAIPKQTSLENNDQLTEAEESETSKDEDESKDEKPEEKPEEKESDEEEKSDERKEKKEPVRKEPSHQEKVELFAKFFKAFKDTLIKMKRSCYKDLDIAGKADFWNNMTNVWKEEYDPRDFMTPLNIEKLENYVVKLK